jgi:hypothetical protein
MLLQCETEYADDDDRGAWLRAGTLTSLRELNAECLDLLLQQALASPADATLAEIARHREALDPAARERASGCLYLLLDAGFAEPRRWRGGMARVADESVPFFTVPAAAQVAQGVLTFAWHLARCQGSAARLLLGMPAAGVGQLARHTLSEVRALALAHPQWLQPRWARRPLMWRAFLEAAVSADQPALERARLRGQRLLAAESRQCLPVPGHALAARPPVTLGRPAARPGAKRAVGLTGTSAAEAQGDARSRQRVVQ